MNTIEVEISHGKLRGIREAGVNIFKGIPYAGRVYGDRRFRRPTELEPWSGVREAIQLGAPAIQPPRQNEPEPSEDCLFLNIWTPANDGQKRPVMFYSHGGGFVIGSGGAIIQDGSNPSRNFDVVVVQTNHRLGLLGFLFLDDLAGPAYEGSGNQGLLDITAALAWVHEHISAFGGDPDNVMIFGESGGGAKTSCLYAMPQAAPYFNKASIESGPGISMYTREMAARTTALVLQELGILSKRCSRVCAHPLYHYFASLLGIRPASFGFENVEIAPMPGHLTKLSGEMVHPRGRIGVNLQFDEGRVHGNVSLPTGIDGTFRYAGKTQDLQPGAQAIDLYFDA